MYNRDNQGSALARRPQAGMSRPRGSDWFWQRDPWQEMQEMQRRMDQLFSRAFGQDWPAFSAPMGQMMQQAGEWGVAEPDIDFSENETEYTIQAALPGISPNDIEVQATEDSIRLTAQSRSAGQPQQAQDNAAAGRSQTEAGQTNAQQAQGQTTQHRQGQFSRVSRFEFAYSLPDEIKPNEVNASFRNGILELHLPKAQPNAGRGRAITIPVQGAENAAQISSATAAWQGATASSGAGATAVGAEHQPGGRGGDGAGANQNMGQAGQSKVNTTETTAKAK
jgi:HSP20 family protein